MGMPRLLVFLVLTVAAFGQTSTLVGTVSPYEGVAAHVPVKITEGLWVRPLLGDQSPVVFGITQAAATSSHPISVCYSGYCDCQFEQNPSVPLQRGSLVISSPNGLCMAATTKGGSVAYVSAFQAVIGSVTQPDCVEGSVCTIWFYGQQRGGAQVGPFKSDVMDLTPGNPSVNSYSTWSTSASQFRHIPFTGNLHNTGVSPPCFAGPCSLSLGGPGLVTVGHHAVGVFYRTEDDIRNTPDDQLSFEMAGETITSVILQTNITDNTVAGQITVSYPLPKSSRVVKTCIAMSKVNENDDVRLHVIECVPSTQTSYTINVADADLTGRLVPQCDTTSGQWFTNGWTDRLSCVSVQSFWDASYFLGPNAGNGKSFSGYGVVAIGGVAGKFITTANRSTLVGGGNTANGGASGNGAVLTTDGHAMFGYGLSAFSVGVQQPGCQLFGYGISCNKPHQLRLGGGLSAADEGKVFVQQNGIVEAGPVGINKTVTLPCGTLIYTNGILTGGSC